MDKEEEEIFLHLLWWSLLKRGDRSTVLCEPVLENPSPTAAPSTHKIFPTEFVIAISDTYTFMAVIKKRKDSVAVFLFFSQHI